MADSLREVDREAPERAIATVRARSEQERERLDEILASEGWRRGGERAAYDCQDSALKLKPWQAPPCWLRTDADTEVALAGPDEIHGWKRAARLVRKLEAGSCGAVALRAGPARCAGACCRGSRPQGRARASGHVEKSREPKRRKRKNLRGRVSMNRRNASA
jgi:hypothetical protein